MASTPQRLEVAINGHVHTLLPFRSPSLGPPAYPWNDYGTTPGGSVRVTPIE
ncbi:hypothetical protein ACVH9Z_28845 [Rhodococcus opacus]|uniref:hypothetical protein n=1 Tax=Rhodococcus TaxID=1827 RepID=UPI0015F6DAAC|nr:MULTISPECIES: hypothetical protein [Rhodococcus]